MELKDAQAQFNLGLMYLDGQDVPQDDVQAAEWFKEAAQQGHAQAQFNLGLMYRTGRGVEQSDKKAAERFEKAAALGNAQAHQDLGVMYADGRGVEQSDEKAAERFEKAAALGNAQAHRDLGFMYYAGRGVKQSDEKAAEWFEKAAALGNAQAHQDLGVIYADGRGVEQSDKKAAEWFEKAAALGNAQAHQDLGVMYADGRGVEQSDEKAAERFEKAAALGNAQAHRDLGFMYYAGRGVKQSDEKAAEWFEKAAALGNAQAHQDLGVIYADGRGVEQSDKKAAEWFEKAAALGNAQAQHNLRKAHDADDKDGDVMSQGGQGVPQDDEASKTAQGEFSDLVLRNEKKGTKQRDLDDGEERPGLDESGTEAPIAEKIDNPVISELKLDNQQPSDKVFVAMSFASKMDDAWLKGIKKAIESIGYHPVRIDEFQHTNDISSEIHDQIKKAKFVVADLTDQNNGVYYEAGYAKGKGKDIFYTCRRDHKENIHFDIRQYNCIFWENDEELKSELQKRIEAVKPKPQE